MRLLQTQDEDLLELAKKRELMCVSLFHISLIFAEVNIPVIVILTKYDLLVLEHYRAAFNLNLSASDRKVEATKQAKLAFCEVIKKLKVPFAPVSIQKEALEEYGGLLF